MNDLELGRHFHSQLSKLVEEPNHPDDDQHDEQVGRALRTAIKDHEPMLAVNRYNAWAAGAGYEPIKYLGNVGQWVRADIVTATVEIGRDYSVRVVEG